MSEGGIGASDDGASEGVPIIARNVSRLRDLVEDVLTLSAYDAAQVSLDLSPTDLYAVVTQCHQVLVASFDARQLEVSVVTEPALPMVLCDRTQIERVVLNLLSNAIKFSHDGQRVRIELRAAGSDVELSISDTGIGIPAGEQERLFSRFFRSSLAVADEIQGTGLGLTLVQTLVVAKGSSHR